MRRYLNIFMNLILTSYFTKNIDKKKKMDYITKLERKFIFCEM